MTLRNRELVNLIAVGALTAIGFTSVYLARQAVVSGTSLSSAALFFVLLLVAHTVVRLALPSADPYLLPLAGLLVAIGLTMIYRIDPDRALRQGLWVVIGLGLFALLAFRLRNYRSLDEIKYTLGLAAIALLALPAVPGLGTTINGASLWVRLGPVSFQPGEFAKVLLVAFLAGYLRDNRELLAHGLGPLRLPSPKHLGPLLLVWGGAMLVLVQSNDLGGGLLYFSVFLAMLYVATGRLVYVGAGLALFSLGAFALYQIVPHVGSRISIWLDPWSDPFHTGYQLVQSIYAIASGGIFGQGLGRGVLVTPSGSTYIPYLETDFIFSGISQELGLAGAAAVVLLYLLIVYRGLRIAMVVPDGFSKLLAAGLTATIGIQAFLIVGGVTGLIPLTGITLPFVSYGGSSIVANFLLLGLLLAISHQAVEEGKRP